MKIDSNCHELLKIINKTPFHFIEMCYSDDQNADMAEINEVIDPADVVVEILRDAPLEMQIVFPDDITSWTPKHIWEYWEELEDDIQAYEFMAWLCEQHVHFNILQGFFHICILEADMFAIELFHQFNLFEDKAIDAYALVCASYIKNDEVLDYLLVKFQYLPLTYNEIYAILEDMGFNQLVYLMEHIGHPPVSREYFDVGIDLCHFEYLFWCMDNDYTPCPEDYINMEEKWGSQCVVIICDYILSRDTPRIASSYKKTYKTILTYL